LTIAIIQLVASKRGIAALPFWAVKPYLDRGYVVARKITEQGLHSNLYAAYRETDVESAYLDDFYETVKSQSFSTLPGLSVLE
ncbi:MAG TPA: LysR family transcriptional regulator, partial [Pasteurellaceae bacterium]|nr:LysR family transcriptional regulator [Pasteurellaceae bacterium]